MLKEKKPYDPNILVAEQVNGKHQKIKSLESQLKQLKSTA